MENGKAVQKHTWQRAMESGTLNFGGSTREISPQNVKPLTGKLRTEVSNLKSSGNLAGSNSNCAKPNTRSPKPESCSWTASYLLLTSSVIGSKMTSSPFSTKM